jgi:hypothetical protein
VVPAQGLVLVLAGVPGLVELVANKPPSLVGAAPATAFVVVKGAALPAMAPDEVEIRKPLALEAAFALRTADKMRVTASVDWGDGANGPAVVSTERAAPAWLLVPASLASVASTSAVYGKAAASHPYATAETYTVRVTWTIVRESDGASSSFTRAQRLRVRDPALGPQQPWRFDLEHISVSCNESQACDMPSPLGTRINAEAAFKFGPSWLAAHTARWDWGDGASTDGTVSFRGGIGRAAGQHPYMKGGRFKVRLTLTGRHKDGTPEARTQTYDVAISDIAIDEVAGPQAPVPSGYPAEFQATFRFHDPKRKRKATWKWGDGETSPGELSERNGTGTVLGQHVYRSAGVFQPQLTIADEESSAIGRTEITVSSPGTVTAGGVIPYPAGVVTSDPNTAGQAQFSLTARHDGTAASGGFRLSAPGFEFLSDHIESLAISGKEAHAAGVGAVNGRRPYSFTVDVWTSPAKDGRPEAHYARVRIHDVARQRALFDNDLFDGALNALASARVTFVGDGE